MIKDDLRNRLTQAMKDKDTVAKDVLRVALGEIQTAEARTNRPLSDEEAVAIVRKLVKSNEETLSLGGESAYAATLRVEIALLQSLLPKTLSVADLVAALASQTDAIKAAKSDGQATGIAMKYLKSTGATFDGNDVASTVKQMRP